VFQGLQASSDGFALQLEDGAERDKRQIKEPLVQASFGIKSALLNLVFGVILTFLSQH
jgi:hypothetical protein